MKIFILSILILSSKAFSCANSIPLSTAVFAIENNGVGREKEMDCKKLPEEPCVCFDNVVEWNETEIADNEVLDYIKKVDEVSCEKLVKPEVIDGEEPLPFNEYQDCDDKFEALSCNGKQEKIKNYDLLEVYCTKEIMKVQGKKLVNSEAKKALKLAEKEAEKLADDEKKVKRKAAKDKVKAFKFKGSTIKELRDELNEFTDNNKEVVE
jgi:hypothetical protein